MEFEKGQLYHIYNRGNNSEKIFFDRENYIYFLDKIKTFITPYCDIIAWTLMPNHFHMMVRVNEYEISVRTIKSKLHNSNRVEDKTRTLNDSIGIMLRSYTNAIQRQEKRTGSLFQGQTKALLLAENQRFVRNWFNSAFGTLINTAEYKSYAETCFHYIHNNAKTAHLVTRNEDWEFSSYRDYDRLRNGKLVNKELGNEFWKITQVTSEGVGK